MICPHTITIKLDDTEIETFTAYSQSKSDCECECPNANSPSAELIHACDVVKCKLEFANEGEFEHIMENEISIDESYTVSISLNSPSCCEGSYFECGGSVTTSTDNEPSAGDCSGVCKSYQVSCDYTKILDFIKKKLTAKGTQGILIGDYHGNPVITRFVGNLIDTLDIDVIFSEMITYSIQQDFIDAYQNTEAPRWGTQQHCSLRQVLGNLTRFGSSLTEAKCSPWSPTEYANFPDEWVSLLEKATTRDIATVAIDCQRDHDGNPNTKCSNGVWVEQHMADVINTYLSTEGNEDHKFLIFVGAAHGIEEWTGWLGVDTLIHEGGDLRKPKLTIPSFDLLPPDGYTDAGFSAATPGGSKYHWLYEKNILYGKTGLGNWNTAPCMCLHEYWKHVPAFKEYEKNKARGADYLIFVNRCNEDGDEFLDARCNEVGPLPHPPCN